MQPHEDVLFGCQTVGTWICESWGSRTLPTEEVVGYYKGFRQDDMTGSSEILLQSSESNCAVI